MALQELATLPTPEWLMGIRRHLPKEFPKQDALKRSVFYIGCYDDPGPIYVLHGNFHNFIYVDYVDKYAGNRMSWLESLTGHIKNSGYQVVGRRRLALEELMPEYMAHPINRRFFFDSERLRRDIRAYMEHPGGEVFLSEDIGAPGAIWTVFEERPRPGRARGDRFSLVAIVGEGVEVYRGLFNFNKLKPAVIAIIRPGDLRFRNPNGSLGTVVLRNNPCGPPDYLLCCGNMIRYYEIKNRTEENLVNNREEFSDDRFEDYDGYEDYVSFLRKPRNYGRLPYYRVEEMDYDWSLRRPRYRPAPYWPVYRKLIWHNGLSLWAFDPFDGRRRGKKGKR